MISERNHPARDLSAKVLVAAMTAPVLTIGRVHLDDPHARRRHVWRPGHGYADDLSAVSRRQ
jgi:hypothetical protein